MSPRSTWMFLACFGSATVLATGCGGSKGTDAGPDSSANSMDAGGGTDAGNGSDSGPPDSGPSDSGPSDSGPSDSGLNNDGGACIDMDHDGAGIGPGCAVYDCNDNDPSIPGPTEICGNHVDDNCNGAIDEGCPCTDASGNTLPDGSTQACGMGLGDCIGTQTCASGAWQACTGRMPSAAEICFNGIDDNCNGQLSEGCCPAGQMPCPTSNPTMCSASCG